MRVKVTVIQYVPVEPRTQMRLLLLLTREERVKPQDNIDMAKLGRTGESVNIEL
jgi:hypothetical protein